MQKINAFKGLSDTVMLQDGFKCCILTTSCVTSIIVTIISSFISTLMVINRNVCLHVC